MTPLYCHLGQIVSDTTEKNDEIPSSKVVKETETTDAQVFCTEDTLKGHAISRDTTHGVVRERGKENRPICIKD